MKFLLKQSVLSLFNLLIVFSVIQPTWGEGSQDLFSFEDGNWAGDGCTEGGLDKGEAGDKGTWVISGNGEMNYPSSLQVMINLKNDLSSLDSVVFELCYRCNSMQTSRASLHWDGVFITNVDASGTGEELRTISIAPQKGSLNLSQGAHVLRISAEDTANQWDYFELDALRIGPMIEPVIKGGVLIPYEIIPLSGANWAGDGGTWGGLDRDANLKSDRSALIVKADSADFPSSFEFKVSLSNDFSHSPARVTIGLRRNQRMVKNGKVYWDGKALTECSPYLEPQLLNGCDSILEEVTLSSSTEEYNFSPGEHTVQLLAPTGELHNAMLQIDSILFESYPPLKNSTRIYLDQFNLLAPTIQSGIEKEALTHFISTAQGLGATNFNVTEIRTTEPHPFVHIGNANSDPDIYSQFNKLKDKETVETLTPFQNRELYFITSNSIKSMKTLYAGGLQPLGTVYAISELELRLRKDARGVYLDFPEGNGDDTPIHILSIPSIEVRGEYMNIGYNHKGITPHEWDQDRWHTYIDQLVLARLNRFYFYIWNDVYTLYPGSTFSNEPLNRTLHENVRDMIEYAHKRGLQITYMMCPTYFPKDIWLSHPEMHADIEYVDHGFPAVCPQSPGAWELMKQIAQSEMEWFSNADSLQIWFYDPGGCWCTQYGCKEHQAETLARQTKEFFSIFRSMNSKATLEYNIWPIWLWEERLGIRYRDELQKRIQGLFPENTTEITAVGASDNEVTLPILEKKAGFVGTAFIFGANPESGYDFLIPHLTYLKETAQRVMQSAIHGAFGHRLEAWTRFPATFFMGEYLWNPNAAKEDVVKRYTNWIAADNDNGNQLAESILLLDQFTYEGADPHIGGRMSRLTQQAFKHVPDLHKTNTEYFPAMMEALAVIGRSRGIEENAALIALSSEFGNALKMSPTFELLASDQKYLFDRYRTFLLRGWKNGAF